MSEFKNWSHRRQLAHVSRMANELPEVLRTEYAGVLADIWDWPDIWIPWMLGRIRELEGAARKEGGKSGR